MFGQHVSPAVVNQLLTQPTGFQSELRDVCILVLDIRGFTAFAETASPDAIVNYLNRLWGKAVEIVNRHHGIVNKFLGDGFMAVFGAPLQQDDHADRGLASALGMHARQAELNRRWRLAQLPEFRLGIGLSTGEVAAALLGSEERLEYTVVGDTVNLAQRLQQWAGPGQIVLSDPTWAALRRPVEAERLPPAHVKGRNAPVGAHRITAEPTDGG